MNYVVRYNGWKIEVTADNKKQARHRAWVKFNETYPTPYGEFMQNIEEVSENENPSAEAMPYFWKDTY